MIENTQSEAERLLYDWQYGRAGSFFATLYDLIYKADVHNTILLRRAYPEEVKSIKRYKNETGYWKEIKLRFDND